MASASMPCELGSTRWAVGDGWIPPYSSSEDSALQSHESVCMLNSGDEPADVDIVLYFADRDPAGPYQLTIPPRRVRHVTLNHLDDPEPVPLATDYSMVISASVPIVVQHTRLDSRSAENALFSTMAFPLAARSDIP